MYQGRFRGMYQGRFREGCTRGGMYQVRDVPGREVQGQGRFREGCTRGGSGRDVPGEVQGGLGGHVQYNVPGEVGIEYHLLWVTLFGVMV